MGRYKQFAWMLCIVLIAGNAVCFGASEAFRDQIYPVKQLKPIDSQLKVKVGDPAPDFTLPVLSGGTIRLSQFKGSKHVVLSFVPAAWTPVCSDQWPGYNLLKEIFEQNNAILIGITVDNLPTLYAWTKQMGNLWFPVASDFWPHGAVADKFGVLRSDGVSERALFIIDQQGIIQYIDVTDINQRPNLKSLITALQRVSGKAGNQ